MGPEQVSLAGRIWKANGLIADFVAKKICQPQLEKRLGEQFENKLELNKLIVGSSRAFTAVTEIRVTVRHN